MSAAPPPRDARDAALQALLAVDRGTHAERAIRAAVAALADVRDRGLAHEIFYGVLRWKLQLDARLAGRVREGTDEGIRHLLRIALYQLYHLDRIPPHAAVNAAVEGARRAGLGHAAGMVNAVLRGLQRAPAWNPPAGEGIDDLAVRYAHPAWLVAAWVDTYGRETAARLLAADQEIPPHGVRVRRGSVDAARAWLEAQGAAVDPSPVAAGALRVRGGGDPQTWPAVQAGDWVLQDEAAQAMTALLPPADRALDLCAAPGGKSFVLADRGAAVTAVEQDRRRLAEMERLRDGLGLTERIRILHADARRVDVEAAPAVLVDAPCSGLGTLRRNPDRKWRDRPDPTLPERQLAILAHGAECTLPGGHLLYLTCTLWRAENEDVVAAFERGHPQFRRESPPHPFRRDDGLYEARPDLHGTDGFFGALWRREN